MYYIIKKHLTKSGRAANAINWIIFILFVFCLSKSHISPFTGPSGKLYSFLTGCSIVTFVGLMCSVNARVACIIGIITLVANMELYLLFSCPSFFDGCKLYISWVYLLPLTLLVGMLLLTMFFKNISFELLAILLMCLATYHIYSIKRVPGRRVFFHAKMAAKDYFSNRLRNEPIPTYADMKRLSEKYKNICGLMDSEMKEDQKSTVNRFWLVGGRSIGMNIRLNICKQYYDSFLTEEVAQTISLHCRENAKYIQKGAYIRPFKSKTKNLSMYRSEPTIYYNIPNSYTVYVLDVFRDDIDWEENKFSVGVALNMLSGHVIAWMYCPLSI